MAQSVFLAQVKNPSARNPEATAKVSLLFFVQTQDSTTTLYGHEKASHARTAGHSYSAQAGDARNTIGCTEWDVIKAYKSVDL